MKKTSLPLQRLKTGGHQNQHARKGAILVLAALMLSIMLVIAAFTVDIGMISVKGAIFLMVFILTYCV